MAARGNTSTEYVLIGAVVLACAIGALALFSVNFNNDFLKGLRSDLRKHTGAAVRQEYALRAPTGTQSAAAERPPFPGLADNMQVFRSPYGNTLQTICYQGGVCVDVPIIEGGGAVSRTSGALGGKLTADMANVFRQIAMQLADDPNADPQIVSLITRLANDGHNVARRQSELLGFCNPNMACRSQNATAMANSAQAQTTQLTPDELQGYMTRINGAADTFGASHQVLQDYLSTHPDALAPGLQSLIHAEAGNITTIAGAFYDPAATNVQVNTTSATRYGIVQDTQTTSWSLAQDPQLTHQSANTICNSGGNAGQCVAEAASNGRSNNEGSGNWNGGDADRDEDRRGRGDHGNRGGRDDGHRAGRDDHRDRGDRRSHGDDDD